jgi:hypothetical protein
MNVLPFFWVPPRFAQRITWPASDNSVHKKKAKKSRQPAPARGNMNPELSLEAISKILSRPLKTLFKFVYA